MKVMPASCRDGFKTKNAGMREKPCLKQSRISAFCGEFELASYCTELVELNKAHPQKF